MKITCIIPAAGKGLRLGGTIPKQYLRIDKIMILEHAVHSLFKGISAYPIDDYACIVACDIDWFETVQDILDRSGFEHMNALVQGGEEARAPCLVQTLCPQGKAALDPCQRLPEGRMNCSRRDDKGSLRYRNPRGFRRAFRAWPRISHWPV